MRHLVANLCIKVNYSLYSLQGDDRRYNGPRDDRYSRNDRGGRDIRASRDERSDRYDHDRRVWDRRGEDSRWDRQ